MVSFASNLRSSKACGIDEVLLIHIPRSLSYAMRNSKHAAHAPILFPMECSEVAKS